MGAPADSGALRAQGPAGRSQAGLRGKEWSEQGIGIHDSLKPQNLTEAGAVVLHLKGQVAWLDHYVTANWGMCNCFVLFIIYQLAYCKRALFL